MAPSPFTKSGRDDLAASAMAAMKDPLAWLVTALALGFLWKPWTRVVTDPDYGWLVWLGDQLSAGHVPRTNGFSWTMPDMPWVTHETLVGLIYASAGPEWVAWLRGLVITATMLLILAATYRRNNAVASIAAFTWAIFLIVYGRTERALSWGNLMLALVTLLVAQEKPARWRMALATVLVGVWANMHGSFVIGVFIVGLANWRWGIAAALATLANPYGIHLWELVVGYGAGEDVRGILGTAILEWSPPDFTDTLTIFRFLALFAAAGLIFWTRARPNEAPWDWKQAVMRTWRPALLWLALTVLSLQHRRFLDIAAIALAPWLATAIMQLVPGRRTILPWPQLALMLPLLAFASRDTGIDRHIYPTDLPFAQFQGKRLWNDFGLGGYLGQHGVRVFWDGRNDCYTAEIFRDGVTIQWLDPGWQDKLDKWRIDTVLTIEPELVDALEKNGWQKKGQWGAITWMSRTPINPDKDKSPDHITG